MGLATNKTPELTGAGLYRLELLNSLGWWVCHRGIDIPDIEGYVARCQANGRVLRAVNKETGQVIGDVTADCPYCDGQHADPYDGSCLL